MEVGRARLAVGLVEVVVHVARKRHARLARIEIGGLGARRGQDLGHGRLRARRRLLWFLRRCGLHGGCRLGRCLWRGFRLLALQAGDLRFKLPDAFLQQRETLLHGGRSPGGSLRCGSLRRWSLR